MMMTIIMMVLLLIVLVVLVVLQENPGKNLLKLRSACSVRVVF
jgi:preprotein translocase subunit SecG